MCVSASTAGNYSSEWNTFEAYCAVEHKPPVSPLLLESTWIQRVGAVVAGQMAEGVLIGFIGWLTAMRKTDPRTGVAGYHYKASTICKYTRDVRLTMERKCGNKFGGGLVPAPVRLPDALTGVVKQRKEGTLARLAVAPQHLLTIAHNEGIIIEARPGRGPLVYFATPLTLSRFEQHRRLCLFGALVDGFCLTMRSMEYLSQKTRSFNSLAALSRADVVYSPDRTCGQMFVKRYKGDSKVSWPNKQLAFAIGGKLCTMTFRLMYEKLNPLQPGVCAMEIPYWQLPDGSCLTRSRLQSYLQVQLRTMGVPDKLYKTHSLRKGGVTAMLAAKVSLPQIQLMARWVSPNMAQLYSELSASTSAEVLIAIGKTESLSLQQHEKAFWTAYTSAVASTP
jgi:hypothetical protein